MLVIAHRGASHDAPENTLAAVQLAWTQGADAVEIDVRLTRDRRLAVIHDPDTRRTAGLARAVAGATLAELQQLEVGRWKGARFAGQRIPALDDIFALVPADKRLFVELKGGPELVEALQRSVAFARGELRMRPEQIAVISFDRAAAAAAKLALPDHEVCWIADSGAQAPHPTLGEIVLDAREAGLDGLDLEANWPVDPRIVQQVRGDGLKVYVWTVDDADLARRLVAAGVDGITTNRPASLRAEIETKRP